MTVKIDVTIRSGMTRSEGSWGASNGTSSHFEPRTCSDPHGDQDRGSGCRVVRTNRTKLLLTSAFGLGALATRLCEARPSLSSRQTVGHPIRARTNTFLGV